LWFLFFLSHDFLFSELLQLQTKLYLLILLCDCLFGGHD
jgi:hypothetical protein